MTAKRIVIDGVEYPSRTHAAKAWDIPFTTFVRRLDEGLSPSEAVRLGPKGRKIITVEGRQFSSMRSAAKFYGINYVTFVQRISDGWSPEESAGLVKRERAVATDRKTFTAVEIEGVAYNSISHAARQRGFTAACIRRRLTIGMTILQAFELEPFPPGFVPGKGQFGVKRKEDKIKREVESGLKQCNQCKKMLPLKNFSKYSKHEKHNYFSRCKECSSQAYLMYRYGVTVSEFSRIGNFQNWSCAICTDKLNMVPGQVMRSKSVGVDHCHTTGKFRGLLCSGCNNALGLFKDSTENLLRAVEYLNNPPASIL